MPLPYVWKPSSDPEQRMGLMIWSYFDESGKLASANDVICLCGYLGDEHWEQFTEEWGVLLKQHNLPSIHMARLRSRKPPFEHIDWDEDQEKKILRRFVEPIRKHTAAFFSVSVDVKHYRSMPREAREAFGQKTALDFSFQRLIRLVISQLQTWNVDYGISMGFDYEELFSLICLRTLAKLRSHYPEVKKLVSAISFCDSGVFYPLQAADMLAYGTYQHLHGNTLDYMDALAFKPTDVGPVPSSEHYSAEGLDSLWEKMKKGEVKRFQE